MVLNDAGISLSEDEKKALSLGLKFIPSHNASYNLEKDLQVLRRNINLKLYWSKQKQQNFCNSYVSKILRSVWNPPESLLESNTLWNRFSLDLKSLWESSIDKSNVPRSVLRAWKGLQGNKDVYVLKADKGGRTIILKRKDYKTEAMRQLSDTSTYQALGREEALSIYESLGKVKREIVILLESKGNITPSEKNRILEEKTKIPPIYFLPKIHKEKRADTGTFPGRPITAAVGSIFKTLDEFLAYTTAPLLKAIPGSLIDTAALLRDLAAINNLPENTILFSADVENLYPSIPWEEGIASATKFYSQNFHLLIKVAEKEGLLPPPEPYIFRRILNLILENNIFHFQNETWYRQKKGTAMGCSMSVFLANTFMYERTRSLIKNPPDGLRYLGRYIDDIVGIWTGKSQEIVNLFNDTIDENIKLTFVIGGHKLEALDITLELDNGKIETVLYRKPTDGNQFVPWDSYHPINLKKSIPYAQFLRIKRNCSREEDYEIEAKDLFTRFSERGYPFAVINNAYQKAALIERSKLLMNETIKKKDEEQLTFVVDYQEGSDRETRKILKDFYIKLMKSPLIQELFEYGISPLPFMPPRVATRVAKALGDNLGPIFKKGEQNAV